MPKGHAQALEWATLPLGRTKNHNPATEYPYLSRQAYKTPHTQHNK